MALAASGILLVVVYAVASAGMPLGRYFPSAGVTVSFVEILGPGWEHPTVVYLSFVFAIFLLYAVALVASWRDTTHGAMRYAIVFGFPVLFALALLALYPPTAMDMFHYHA